MKIVHLHQLEKQKVNRDGAEKTFIATGGY